MENFNKVLLTAGIFLQYAMIISAACSDHTDCTTCTSDTTWTGETCRWCPLNNQCHTSWSLYNPCYSGQYIVDISKCWDEEDNMYRYNVTEAYKMAIFSAITYGDKPTECLKTAFPDGNYTIVDVLKRDCDDFILDYDKQCLAMVVYSDVNKEIIVSFGGSMGIAQLIDQILVTLTQPSVAADVGGKVEEYFDNVYRKFYSSIKELVRNTKITKPDYQVKLTGHSLGGTTASITSAMLVYENITSKEETTLYTFGMPRVGNKDYAIQHDKLVPDSWRVVRKGDIVARLPACGIATCTIYNGPYHHGNKIMYKGKMMTTDSVFSICDGNEDTYNACTEVDQDNLPNSRIGNIIRYKKKKHTYYFDIPISTYCKNSV